MLILLPPSETKRDGGAGAPVDLGSLFAPELAPVRREVLSALTELSADREASLRALKLGPKQSAEVDRNRGIAGAPTMRALERYTGVLYDALDAAALDERGWEAASRSVVVHSALFGLVGATDLIPAYRLSFDSRLSLERGAPSLKKRWSGPVASVLAGRGDLVLDLRSEGYAALGPLPDREGAHYVRILARDDSGAVRALNHFNKQAKGLFTRALLDAGVDLRTTNDLLDWARAEGYDLTLSDHGSRELRLVVPEVSGEPGKLLAVLRMAS
ncbi:YaaA family protein [Leifsonia sp. AG29]|uniref:YaaA family protein n=1 Tax=Leifsonia sp. AG29 TaxID=2598860 RepID=UPI00131A76E5|nr:peroxide stress protein YaaA [Leifsonia sp. AG29]